jgi:hypothetical protein
MIRWWLFTLVLAFTAMISAQGNSQYQGHAPYQPAVPPPSTNVYGGYGGGYGGYGASTAAGSAMNGMAGVISAQGQRNLSNSAAAVNWTQAQKNEIENRQLATDTYFNMRATNKAAVAAERGPSPTMEQLVRYANAGVPRPLAPNQFDAVTGKLYWPSALQDDGFATERTEVDRLFAERAKQGGLDYASQMKIRQSIETMFKGLKSQIQQIPPQDYSVCRAFLQSALFAASGTQL